MKEQMKKWDLKKDKKSMLKNVKLKEIGNSGVTLIALVVTIIVLLILARSINTNANRGKWAIENGTKCKR